MKTDMDVVLEEVDEGRRHAIVALDILEKRRDQHPEVEKLRSVVGELAGLTNVWAKEKERWR